MVQLFTFFLSVLGAVLLARYKKLTENLDDENDDALKSSPEVMTSVKTLPMIGITWLLFSFTTFIDVFIEAINCAFIDDVAGYIVMIVLSLIFLCCWG